VVTRAVPLKQYISTVQYSTVAASFVRRAATALPYPCLQRDFISLSYFISGFLLFHARPAAERGWCAAIVSASLSDLKLSNKDFIPLGYNPLKA
jgi:hypothetical protein